MVLLATMKSFSSAEKDDDAREWAQKRRATRHAPGGTSPEALRSTPISENVLVAASIEPAALSELVISPSLALPPGRMPQHGATLALKQVLPAGLGVLPVPVEKSIQT